jgi:phospho-N-acetylmuramoyl-pentapeptide-transferase
MLFHLLCVLGIIHEMPSLYGRCFLAFAVALALSLAFGGKVIACLHAHQLKGQPIREDGPQSHLLTKKGTPTMGGFLILGAAILSMLLFCDLSNVFVWIGIGVLLIYGAVGFADDYVKVTKQTANAMTAKMKLVLQFSTALAAVLLICYATPAEHRFGLNFPYINVVWNLGWLYVPFAMIVMAGASNGVNLSDGLDGLAAGLLGMVFGVFMIAAYGLSAATALHLAPEMALASEAAVMCAAVIGGCLGFLWFNAKPAQVFMGDIGSLSLGAFLGVIAVMLKQEILLAIAGGVFVAESVSVMIQVWWFRHTGGKRFFKMAPIHHHFEQCGWAETKVVFRFWLVGLMLAAVALMAL